MPANIETDPFFVLLTDALRTGPGSPQWEEAVASLRLQGLEAADEHRLLMDARENLESGREYRSVRAGAGFTRKVMEEIESGPAGQRPNGIPTATFIATICGLLILGAVGYFSWQMSSRPINTQENAQELVADLESKSQGFVDQIASATFSRYKIPNGWRVIGSLQLDVGEFSDDYLIESLDTGKSTTRPYLEDQSEHFGDTLFPLAPQKSENLGGGLVIDNPLPAGQPFAVDVSLLSVKPTNNVLLEIFVTADGKFSPDKATSSHDLVWQLRQKEQNVLVNGSGKIGDASIYHPNDVVRLIVGQDVAIVETVPTAPGKIQRLWSGLHELGPGPRYVGVRFLQTDTMGRRDVSVQSIKVTTSPKQ